MNLGKRRVTSDTTPTRSTRRRISTQRQREEEEEASIRCDRKLAVLAQHARIMDESEENSSYRHIDEGKWPKKKDQDRRSLRKKRKLQGIILPKVMRMEDVRINRGLILPSPLHPVLQIVHLQILPTPSEMKMNFLTGFVSLEVTRGDKIKKLERDLIGVVDIKKDCRVIENDLDPSRALVKFGIVEDILRMLVCDFDGVGGGGGRGEGFCPINEEVRYPPETPSTRGESSTVGAGTSK
ncbi:hypothetical protein HAX54_002464, partial [Datura stramonium]|nr:hypothetical protein [Datura stramonium]